MKTVLIIGILAIVILASGFLLFSGSNNSSTEEEFPLPSEDQISDSISSDDLPVENPDLEGEPQSNLKEFNLLAMEFEFSPEIIEVNEGDTVILNVKSVDVPHGIAIPQFGISEELNPGDEVKIEFVADKKGSYTFFCNVFCGSGHQSMKGTLIVN